MVVDGKKIAQEVYEDTRQKLSNFKHPLRLAVFVTNRDFVTDKFIGIKRRTAEQLGIKMDTFTTDGKEGTEEFLRNVLHVARAYDGIVVQMPIAPNLDLDAIRQLIPITHDVDVFGHISFTHFKENRLPIMPPVTAAIVEILKYHKVGVAGKNVVVVGEGRLVGQPTAFWAEYMGAYVTTVNKETEHPEQIFKDAEILILGAGVPGLITPEKISEGVIIIDAGTSETSGKLAGDADPLCAEKASLFTPVPGGVGPVAVAMIYRNLATLTMKREGIAL